MRVNLVVASLLLVAVGSECGSLDFLRQRIVQQSIAPLFTCTTGDVFCGPDCTTVQLCLADNQQFTLNKCVPGTLCDSSTMTCSKTVTVCRSPPDESLFRCHSDGLFPNPYDCHTYFDCNPSAPSPTTAAPTTAAPSRADPFPDRGTLKTCPGKTAYDPLSATCRFTSSARVCKEGPIPKCLAPAQNGAQQENPNIYYVCVNDPSSNSLVPWIFRCKDVAQIFQNGHCVIPEI